MSVALAGQTLARDGTSALQGQRGGSVALYEWATIRPVHSPREDKRYGVREDLSVDLPHVSKGRNIGK
jgi:hypothetical protein